MKLTKEERKQRRAKIKAWFINAGKKIKAWFKKLDDEIIPQISSLALKIMNGIKSVSESEITKFLADLTKSDFDNDLLDSVNDALDKAISATMIWKECEANETLADKIICFMTHIKSQPIEKRAMLYNALHANLIGNLDSNKLQLQEYYTLAVTDKLADTLA